MALRAAAAARAAAVALLLLAGLPRPQRARPAAAHAGRRAGPERRHQAAAAAQRRQRRRRQLAAAALARAVPAVAELACRRTHRSDFWPPRIEITLWEDQPVGLWLVDFCTQGLRERGWILAPED